MSTPAGGSPRGNRMRPPIRPLDMNVDRRRRPLSLLLLLLGLAALAGCAATGPVAGSGTATGSATASQTATSSASVSTSPSGSTAQTDVTEVALPTDPDVVVLRYRFLPPYSPAPTSGGPQLLDITVKANGSIGVQNGDDYLAAAMSTRELQMLANQLQAGGLLSGTPDLGARIYDGGEEHLTVTTTAGTVELVRSQPSYDSAQVRVFKKVVEGVRKYQYRPAGG